MRNGRSRFYERSADRVVAGKPHCTIWPMRGATPEAFRGGVVVSVRNGFSLRSELEAAGYAFGGRAWSRCFGTLEEAEAEQARVRGLIAGRGGLLRAI